MNGAGTWVRTPRTRLLLVMEQGEMQQIQQLLRG